jgi:hypothetical protein
MRLQHAKQAASGLSTDTPGRMQAKVVIVAEVERLHWRIWNGKAKNARRTRVRSCDFGVVSSLATISERPAKIGAAT